MFKKRPISDILAVDIATSGIKAVRLKKSKEPNAPPILTAVALLPPVTSPEIQEQLKSGKPLSLPKELGARQVSLALSGKNAGVKVLNFVGKIEQMTEPQIRDMMGLDKTAEIRISYAMITEGYGRTESKVLTVSLPEVDAKSALQLFPIGLPAPYSVEISGLASMTSFLNGPAMKHMEDTVGVMDFGAEVTLFALFKRNALSLVRKFEFGSNAIISRIQKTMGVDEPTALQIFSSGSIDLSHIVGEVMDSFLKQLVISRDFVERRENCHVSNIYVTGSGIVSRDWVNTVHSALGMAIETWNPFDAVTIAPGAVPEELAGKESRFTAAMGTALATFEIP